MKKYLFFILIPGLIISSFQIENGNIGRLNMPSISRKILEVIPHVIEFNDTIPSDTLFEHIGENQVPIMYSRKIQTEVCIDGKCRIVHINLFWNITGRYLGFNLPNGEFLSKTEHDPFNTDEYDRLHILLADPRSALANFSIQELVPAIDSSETKVDAVSSATIAAVLDYIVEGAVYTTYTLWHIVYGPTKREIEKLTSEKLTSEIALELLNSNKLEDQVWVLNHISTKKEISLELLQKLISIISGNDVYLAERSLNALKPELLNKDIQQQLASIFKDVGFLQKRLIIQKLKEIPNFDNKTAIIFSEELNNMNGTLTKSTLELFLIHNIENEEIVSEVERLLTNKNRFISKQAFLFLKELDNPGKGTLKNIEKYKKKNG